MLAMSISDRFGFYFSSSKLLMPVATI